jgi:hypothetical protein
MFRPHLIHVSGEIYRHNIAHRTGKRNPLRQRRRSFSGSSKPEQPVLTSPAAAEKTQPAGKPIAPILPLAHCTQAGPDGGNAEP